MHYFYDRITSGTRQNIYKFSLLIICLFSCYHSTAQAAIIFDADDVVTTSNPVTSTFGTVDVFVLYDGLSPANAMVSAYNVILNLAPAAINKVQFLEAVLTSPSTSSAITPRLPLFAGQDPFEIQLFNPLPGQNITFSDDIPGVNQSTPLFNNRALASIRYEVLPGASGTFNFTFDPSQTFLIDGNNNAFTINSLLSGSITVTAIPEPGTILLVSMLAGIGLFSRLRRIMKSLDV